MFWKFLKSSTETSGTASPTPDAYQQTLALDFLKKLVPIGNLPDEELQALTIRHRRFLPGQIIFTRGESTDSLIYLFSGSLFLEAANGNGYSVDEASFTAYHPLSTETKHLFSAIAKTACQIIYLPLSALQRSSKAVFINNPLINPKDTPAELCDSVFFNGFCTAFRRDELHTPSLPDVAIRLRRALQQDVNNISDVVKITNLDPVIASKLIQVANSPLYRAINPISNSHDAINRLGFKTTQNLVTSISLHNLFRSNNKLLNQRVQQLWKQSIQIASLSYALANLTKSINPDEALLAGLTYNIGALPIISYAATLKDADYNDRELDQTISILQGLVGVFILNRWNFPEYLQSVPRQASHWYHDDNSTLQISDIVLLARFHAELGTPHSQKLPPLNTLPAFLKLGEHALTPDMSLQALHEAKQQIAEAMSFFRT